VGALPEQLLIAEGKLYVANSGDNTVTVINTATDAVEKTLTVADAPNSLALDRNNDLWVLSSGNKAYDPYPVVDEANSTAGALTKINTSNSSVASTIAFQEVAASAGKLTLNGSRDKLYFVYGNGVHQLDINATSLNPTPLIDRSFYGLGVDPDNGYLYAGDENAFTGDGTVFIYKPDGTKVSEFKTGIGPNGFVFN
jgi:YVTN family beta-propeller protein